MQTVDEYTNRVLVGDARTHLARLPAESVDLSFWSPPYFVGKTYEQHLGFEDWKTLLKGVVSHHTRVVKPGGFLAVNIGDILCFPDPAIPKFQANSTRSKKVPVSRGDIVAVQREHPHANRRQLAEMLGCSEQTIQRRLENNNVRGGRPATPTRVLLTGNMVCEWAEQSGFYLYDQRIWHKDPCWANNRWHAMSYRAVDEFEHVYVFWKPGITEHDRARLSPEEWSSWGSRGVWKIPSVHTNTRHEAEFPEELARRVIRLFSPPGGVVLDTFVGAGTTTAVARQLGRQWIGIELNGDTARMALERTRRQTESLFSNVG